MHQQTHVTGTLVAVQRAMPQTRSHPDGEWTTAFYKQPVQGLVAVTVEGLDGDGVADRVHHGGIDKAVLAYSADNYQLWQDELGLVATRNSDPLAGQIELFGMFGENVTIRGLDETNVCIGDRFRVGDVLFEVSQPRQPCWKLARRWDIPQLPKLVVQNGRSGWYLRVVEEGKLQASDSVQLESRPNPDWTVARTSQIFYRGDAEQKLALREVRELADVWKSN